MRGKRKDVKTMKKLLQKRNKKGFTLAELLIVIAIIAVLIAIMFPVFGAQLNKAKLAADTANVRAAYSEAVADAMLDADVTTIKDGINVIINESVAKNNSTVSVNNDTHVVTVALSGNSQTFDIDEDVTLTVTPRA